MIMLIKSVTVKKKRIEEKNRKLEDYTRKSNIQLLEVMARQNSGDGRRGKQERN